MSSSSQPDPSSSSHEDPAPPSPQPQEVPQVKEPVIDFIVGEHIVRDALPCPLLPRELNPRCVDYHGNLNNLPLVWFGVEFDQGKLLRYAVSRGYGIWVDADKAFDDLETWVNFGDKYYEKYGLRIQLREVWGCNMHVLSFYGNRELLRLTGKHRKRAIGTMLGMGYELKDMQWWLDLDEEV